MNDDKVCASGLKAMSLAASSLALGHRFNKIFSKQFQSLTFLTKYRGLVVAGGMESLSNTPYALK